MIRFFPAVLTIFALVAASPASARSCVGGLLGSLPQNDATDVPVNAIVQLQYENFNPDELELSLTDADGVAVRMTTEIDGQASHFLVRALPDEDLEPDTAYVLHDGTFSVQFTTGASRDETAPDTPVIVDTDRGWRSLSVSAAPSSEPLMLAMRVTEAGGEERGVVHAVSDGGTNAYLYAGTNSCLNSMQLRADPRHEVILVAVDMAGNVSEEAADRVRGACSTGAAPASLVGLLLPLALVLVGRRRRSD